MWPQYHEQLWREVEDLTELQLRLFAVVNIEIDPDPIEEPAIVGEQGFSAGENPPVRAGSVPGSKSHFARGCRPQTVCPDSPRLFEVVWMQECEMGVPGRAGVDTESQR